MLKRLAIGLVCIAALTVPAFAAVNGPVKVDGGLVTGSLAWGEGVRMFRGIPFAAPPVGQNRWREPQPVVPWQGVRKADHFSPACMQEERPVNTAPWNTGEYGYSEDCLYLNVWTPAKTPADKLPVMVWIYGGGGKEGSGAEALYDPNNLAKRGVVVVSFNYRVNLFGWMAHPELTRESPHHASGNYGALDQVAAIAWVKRNIAGFGGDPNRITIFGESGGSRSVNWVSASPLAKGLFQGAIAQSHTVFDRMETLKEAEANGQKLGQALGAPTLAQMRALPAKTLMDYYLKHNIGMTAAIVDGYFLPTDIKTIYEKGQQSDVPLITGGDGDEPGGKRRATPPKTVKEYTDWASQAYGPDAAKLLTLYPARTDKDVAAAYRDLLRDGNFAGHRTWAQLQSKTGKSPVFMYLFTHAPAEYGPDGKSLDRSKGAPHGADVPYVFDNLRYADKPWTKDDVETARTTADYWVNFAKSGNPNGPGLANWPVYKPSNEMMLNIGDTRNQAEKLRNIPGLDFLAAHSG